MRFSLKDKWDLPFERRGQKVRLDDDVVCSKDWTERPESGGFIFGSYAYCPDCAAEGLKSIAKYGEQKHLQAMCPAHQSFADFVRFMRGSSAYIRVS